MRSIALPLFLIGSLAFCGSAVANEISMHKHSAEEIKTICDKVGGKFSQDAGGYGCGTNCNGGPGTDCIVSCKTEQQCYAQVIGSRRPTTVLNALQWPARHTR